jgi:hypothetical protein
MASSPNPQTFPHSWQNAVRWLATWNQRTNEKTRNGDRNSKEDRRKGSGTTGEQALAGTARARTTNISGNSTKLVQTNPKTNKSISHQKTRYDRRKTIDFYRQICIFVAAIFESVYSDIADQNSGLNPIPYTNGNNSLQ